MTERECLEKMIAPCQLRQGKPLGGVIQIWVTRACNLSCYGCTQGANLVGNPGMITPDQFEQACLTLRDYFGVVGVFGGNPCLHPQFEELCTILRRHIPYHRRGLWSNNLWGHGACCRQTFNPSVSNLNVHLDKEAWVEIKRDWPEAQPFGLLEESRHSPPYVAMKDVVEDESERWFLISKCDINQHWSSMIGVFRGQLRAWFCEIAGAQSMLHRAEPNYPDTGVEVKEGWWRRSIITYTGQIRKHCHECGVPLRGYGELSQARHGKEQMSEIHQSIFKTKRPERLVELVTDRCQLGSKDLKFTEYLQGARK